MKRDNLFLLTWILIILIVVIKDSHDSHISLIKEKLFHLHPLAAEGTKNNTHACGNYEWMLLHNPISKQISHNQKRKGNNFIKKMKGQLNKSYIPVAEEWTSRGPHNIGGRTKALAIDVLNENIILANGLKGLTFMQWPIPLETASLSKANSRTRKPSTFTISVPPLEQPAVYNLAVFDQENFSEYVGAVTISGKSD